MEKPAGRFKSRLTGVILVGGLTYVGEYIAYLIILVWIQDKLVTQFQFGTYAVFVVGVIAGVYLIVSGLLAVPFGHMTDRYGRRLFAVLGSLISGISLAALIGVGSIADPTLFLVAIGVILVTLGFGHATYTASTWAYVGDIASDANMGKSYGLLEVAEYGGFAFGPGIGIFIANFWGREPTFAVASALVLTGSAVAFLLMKESGRDGHRPKDHTASDSVSEHTVRITWGSFVRVLRNPVVAATLMTTFFMSLALQAFYIYVPLLAQQSGNLLGTYGPTSGFIATLAAGTSIVLMFPVGYAVDATKRRMPWLVFGLLIGSLALISVLFLRGSLYLALAAYVFGTGLAAARVSQAVILAEGSSVENRATVMGTNHAVEHAGYGVGAFSGGALIAALGFENAFGSLSALLLIAAIGFLFFALYRKLK